MVDAADYSVLSFLSGWVDLTKKNLIYRDRQKERDVNNICSTLTNSWNISKSSYFCVRKLFTAILNKLSIETFGMSQFLCKSTMNIISVHLRL